MTAVLDRLARVLIHRITRRPPDLTIGEPHDPYLQRWYLIPRNPVANLYLHHFLRDDDDRALHDHPWSNLSLILRSGYDEVLFARRPVKGSALPRLEVRPRRPFRPVLRGPRTPHRIRLLRDHQDEPVPAWSLFLTGPRLRIWGFWCPQGRWVPWRAFTAGDRGERIGRGCA